MCPVTRSLSGATEVHTHTSVNCHFKLEFNCRVSCKFHNFWRFSKHRLNCENECAVNERKRNSERERDFKSGDESMNENFRAIYASLGSSI